MLGASDDGPSASGSRGVRRQLQEVIPGYGSTFPVPRVQLEHSGLTSISASKHLNMTSRPLMMAKNPFLSCHDLHILLGHLTSVCPAVPLLRLHSRFLQLNLNSVYWSEKDNRRQVPLSSESRRDLRWIASLEPHQCTSPMWYPQLEDCTMEVLMDARTPVGGFTSAVSFIGAFGPRLPMPQSISMQRNS